MAALANVYAKFAPDISDAIPKSLAHPTVSLNLKFDFRTPPPRTPTRTAIIANPRPVTAPKQSLQISASTYESEHGTKFSMHTGLASPKDPDWAEDLFTPDPNDASCFSKISTATSADILESHANFTSTGESLTSFLTLELPCSSPEHRPDAIVEEDVADAEGGGEIKDNVQCDRLVGTS